MDQVKIKVKFRPSSIADKEGTICYQVTYRGSLRQVSSGYHLFPGEWDNMRNEIVVPSDADDERKSYLLSIRAAIHRGLQRFGLVVSRLESLPSGYTAADVIANFLSADPDDVEVFRFCADLIERIALKGNQRTAERYATVINSFKRFRKGAPTYFSSVDTAMMIEYESYLKGHALCLNTVSYYIRGFRAIYNRAVEEELIPQRNPFRRVYTGIGKTVKRAIPIELLKQIKTLDLSKDPTAAFARDIFMFSFYTRGMAIVDIVYMRKESLSNGVLTYRRQKTGQELVVKWEPQMQEIIDRYMVEDSPYMFPILKNPEGNERRQYKSAAHKVNHHLKKIGRKLGLNTPLTSYVARHTWASVAKSQNIPISVISEAMGHDSEKTTRIYLATLDTTEVDNANEKILKLV